MATKWKKSKAALGFLSFALGVSLVLSCALPLISRFSSQEGRQRLKGLLSEDFQQTASFRNYLSDLMNDLISMGAGGPLDSYYGYYGAAYDEMLWEGDAITAVAEDSGWEWGLSENGAPSETDRKLWKRQAEAYHKAIQEDKNILYQVEQGGKTLYSNSDFDLSVSLPDGYGFWLLFDGTKCTAYKDGQETDLYGDGVYKDDGEHWYLPGYRNFPAGNDAAQVEVALAVADVPALYLRGDYTVSGVKRQNNQLYWLEGNWQQEKVQFRRSCALLVLGAALLAVCLVLRKDKARADRAVAGVTGHLWFELKLLLALAAIVFFLFPFNEEMRHLLSEAAYVYTEGGSYWEPWFLSSYWSQVVSRPALLLIAFWVLYLFINDLRYGDKPWRHGLCGMLAARSLKLSIQKRLSRRAGLAAAILILLALALLTLAVLILSINQELALVIALPALLLTFLGVWAVAGRSQRRLWQDLGLLTDQISAIKAGDLSAAPLIPESSDLYVPSRELAQIGQGMEQAVAEQTRSERMKVELITNVSHDLKTPLTSIISYAELLKQEHLDPPAGEYVEVLSQKAERLRAMVLDVFEVSKAASGDLPVKLEPLDLSKLLRQTLADMSQAIDDAPVTLRESLPETPVPVKADGDRLYRVFQNLLQNALQYALEGSRVYLTLEVEDGKAIASVKNTSKTELPDGVDFTARFVRGDESRTDGGSGLGLAIAQSFTAACGGELKVEPVADLFVVTVTFPLSDEEPTLPS